MSNLKRNVSIGVLVGCLVVLISYLMMMKETVAVAKETLPTQVSFQDQKGWAMEAFEGELVHFIMTVNHLNDDQKYIIQLEDQGVSRVAFDSGNSVLKQGAVAEEFLFSPQNGKLMVWSTHAKRILDGAKEARIIIRDQNKNIVTQTEPLGKN